MTCRKPSEINHHSDFAGGKFCKKKDSTHHDRIFRTLPLFLGTETRCYTLYDTIIINAPQAQTITISTATAERNVEVSRDPATTPTTQPLPEEIIKKRLKEQWEPKKKDNVFLSNIYIAADMANSKNKATRLRNCARWLEFAIAEGQPAKLVKTSSCHVRLCPVCQWRRSLATFRTLARIYSSPAVTRHKHLFLTLTQRNIPAAELGAELNRI